MAASDAALANAALSHLGATGTAVITVLSSDTTPAGKALREHLPRARRETIAAAPWSVATKTAALTLIQTFSTTASGQAPEWQYQYRLPEDCLHPWRVLNPYGLRNPLRDQEPPFRVVADTDSTAYSAATTYATGAYSSVTTSGSVVWYRALRETINDPPASSASDWVAVSGPGGVPDFLETDIADARLEYAYDLTDPTRFGPDLEAAIVALLAYYASTAITVNGSARDVQQKVAGIWEAKITQAMKNDTRKRVTDPEPVSRYEAARYRGGWGQR